MTQTMTESQRATLMKARAFIDKGQYHEAQKLLKKVNHPTAKAWLVKLEDAYLPKPKKRNWLRNVLLGLVGIVILIPALLPNSTTPRVSAAATIVPFDKATYEQYYVENMNRYSPWGTELGGVRAILNTAEDEVNITISYIATTDVNGVAEQIMDMFIGVVDLADRYHLRVDTVRLIAQDQFGEQIDTFYTYSDTVRALKAGNISRAKFFEAIR